MWVTPANTDAEQNDIRLEELPPKVVAEYICFGHSLMSKSYHQEGLILARDAFAKYVPKTPAPTSPAPIVYISRCVYFIVMKYSLTSFDKPGWC